MTYAFSMEVVSGSDNGTLYLWKGTNTYQKYIRQHEGRVTVLISVK